MIFRSIIVLLLAAWLQPGSCFAQTPAPDPIDIKYDTKKKAEEEAKRKAEEEAKRKAMILEQIRREEAKKASEKAAAEKAKNYKPESGSGFQLVKIPVTGIYYLGMRRKDYDSLALQHPLFISTVNDRYAVKPSAHFLHGRLYHLILTLPDSIFSSDMTDITQYYQSKLGKTDEQWISDSSMVFPSEADSSLQGTYRVKQARLTWHYNYHDVRLWYHLTDMKNGQWKGSYLVSYSGNGPYIGNLRGLEEKEKNLLGGY